MSEEPTKPIEVKVTNEKEYNPYDSYQTELDDIEMSEQEMEEFDK